METWNSPPEKDKLFEHTYDGIQEYDNPMPAWWVWLFVLTVVIAYPYIVRYHFGPGKSPQEKWLAEQEAYSLQLLATYGELEADRETLLTYMDDATAMTGMSGLFRGRCAQCHVADGSGNVGPNLTDDRWINVKQITDIPEIIRTGLSAKGMPGWGDRLTETQIVLLSSYVAQLTRQPVEGKAPEGEPLVAWDQIEP